MNELAFIFPGQGSQYVGMGKDFSGRYRTARDTFEEADDILGFPLSGIMFEGPEEELVKTKNTQPAILAHSIALMRLLQEEGVRPAIVAGHSLGEYSAHVCAGSMTYPDALRTVRLRGELMYEAGLKSPGTMAAILGMTREEIDEICREGSQTGIVEPANFNSPEQIVVSGEVKGVEEAMRIAKERGAKRAIRLDVSGAFHSSLMGEALPGLEEHLGTLTIEEAEIPVVANVDATGVQDREGIRRRLKEQLMKPVLWSDSIRTMTKAGAALFVEVGPGKVLCRLMKKIDDSVSASSVDGVENFDTFLSEQQERGKPESQ